MEQRRTRRFQLELPLSVIRAGAERVTLAGLTKNISSCGVLFTTGKEPDLGGPIEYIITLNHDGPQPVNLRCVGKVLRAERAQPATEAGSKAYQIAATLERYEFVRERTQHG
ncbi:MAG TPA: PilZ domain-containing protein [Bryobacteraceae bacterium]|nr:PilZ domain-containing protein [Bryobacteraceae bacterium]